VSATQGMEIVWSTFQQAKNAERYARGHLTRDNERTLCGRKLNEFWDWMSKRDRANFEDCDAVGCARCRKIAGIEDPY
jgi:hypothetical protein